MLDKGDNRGQTTIVSIFEQGVKSAFGLSS